MAGGSREPLTRLIVVAGHAVAALVEQPQGIFGEIETALGGSAEVGEAARRVDGGAGAGEERQPHPVTCEELRSSGVAVERCGALGVRMGYGGLEPFVGA